MMQIVSFTNDKGRILATAGIPAEVLTEGNQGDIKPFDVSAKVIRAGRVSKFICMPLNSEVVKGAVVQKPEGGPGRFTIDRLDVKPGEVITGTFQALTVKEDRASEDRAA